MDLTELLDQIDELKDQIDSLRPIDPWQEKRIWQKLRLDWNYHSNAIEGNTLTLGETRLFLLHGLTAKGKPFKDYLDIKGHNEAISYLQEMVRQQVPLTEAVIRELHTILLVEPYEMDAVTPDGQPTKRLIVLGEYKSQPNHVETKTGEMFFFAEPHETPAQMGDLMAWYRAELEKKELHPVLIASTFHYRFVRIHPFDDGNGRMARLLMNLILMQAGYVPLVIKFESKEEEYFPALVEADTTNDLTQFQQFIAKQLLISLDIFLKGAEGKLIEQIDDIDKQISLLKQEMSYVQSQQNQQKLNLFEGQKTIFRLVVEPFFRQFSLIFEKFEPIFQKTKCWEPSIDNIHNEIGTQFKNYFEYLLSQFEGDLEQTYESHVLFNVLLQGIQIDSKFRILIESELFLTPYIVSIEIVIRMSNNPKNIRKFERNLEDINETTIQDELNEFLLDGSNYILDLLHRKNQKELEKKWPK